MLQGDLRPSRRLVVLVALVLALAAAGGCGGGSTGNGTTEPTASAPEATAPPTDATQPGTGATTTPTGTTPAQTETLPSYRGQRGSTTESGGRNVRVPATFTVVGSRLEPRTITVPPFLAIQLTLRASDRQFHRLRLLTPEGRELDLGAEQRKVSLLIPGQRAGRYKLRLDYEPTPVATLVVGGEVGP